MWPVPGRYTDRNDGKDTSPRSTRNPPPCALVLAALFERGKLRVEVGKSAMELVRVPLVLAEFQIALDTRPRKQQHLLAAPGIHLLWRHLRFCILRSFRGRILNLSFH